jgi:hypothetical protein
MIFNGRDATQENVDFANHLAMVVVMLGFPAGVSTNEEAQAWVLEACGGDEWLADFAGFVIVVTKEMMETGCTQDEAMAKHVALNAQQGA